TLFYFFSRRRLHKRSKSDWSSDVCSSDLAGKRTGWKAREIAVLGVGKRPCPQAYHNADGRIILDRKRIRKRINLSMFPQRVVNQIGRPSCREKLVKTVV